MHTMSKDAPGDEEEEDGVSEVASLEEPKEEDQGEGYLSEMDNEPPVSESDDGFSIHNATLQSHTLADSIPSSPASSQLWVYGIPFFIFRWGLLYPRLVCSCYYIAEGDLELL